jgi:MraZ protein
MFLGDFEHSLDDKNRVILPAPLRRGITEDELQDRFYLVPSDEDECLELHPRRSWDQYVTDLKDRYDWGDRTWRDFLRDLYSTACEIQLDKQYRFLLPETCKKAVAVQKDVYFVGLGEFVEIWSKERWEGRRVKRAGKRITPARRGAGEVKD